MIEQEHLALNGHGKPVKTRKHQRYLCTGGCGQRKSRHGFPKPGGVYSTVCHLCTDAHAGVPEAPALPRESIPLAPLLPASPFLSMRAGYGFDMLVAPKSDEITLVQEAVRIFLTPFEGRALHGALSKLAFITQ